MTTTDPFVIAVSPDPSVADPAFRPYWAIYVYGGPGAQPIAESAMNGLLEGIRASAPPGGGSVSLVNAGAPTVLLASGRWTAAGSQHPVTVAGMVGAWWDSFVSRWASNWWRR